MWAQRQQMFPVQRSYIHVSRCDRTRDEFISCTKLDAWLHLLSPLCPRQALATVKLSLCLRNTAMHCFNFWKFSEIFADAVWSEVSHVTTQTTAGSFHFRGAHLEAAICTGPVHMDASPRSKRGRTLAQRCHKKEDLYYLFREDIKKTGKKQLD